MTQQLKTRAELAEMIRQVQESMHEQLQMQILSARLSRAKYLALRTEGFTEKQALELCKP